MCAVSSSRNSQQAIGPKPDLAHRVRRVHDDERQIAHSRQQERVDEQVLDGGIEGE